MRPATAVDVPAVTALIHARCDWMEERGLPSWREAVDHLAGQAADDDGSMWLLEDDGGGVVGCTTVQTETPPWGWNAEELAEPAYYLYTTVTDPAHHAARPGTIIANWAVDRAARDGKAWVRRGCLFPRLVRYYESQGFTLFYEVQRTHNLVYLMGRRAERLPGLEMFGQPTEAWK